MNENSGRLYEQSKQYFPGGVNSPVRSFNAVGGVPVFFERARGAELFDVDGNKYIDYIGSWGPMILGHANKEVVERVKEALDNSFSFGTPTAVEAKIGALITEMAPGVTKIRMVNSGTEACMSAIRLARAYTEKDKFIKFEGCYHGHANEFLIKAGSGLSTFGFPNSPGVTEGAAKDTLVATYNDLTSVQDLIDQNMGQVAAIILEPVAGNMGCIPPAKEFVEGVRKLCDQYGILLIFDEVMTGFRLAPGGAQELLGVQADLVCYGKVIGGGMPVGAYGGNDELMSMIAPEGPVYQAGTLSGNPIAMTAGLATLTILHENRAIYQALAEKTKSLAEGIKAALEPTGLPYTINRLGSMMSVHFTSAAVTDFNSAAKGNNEYFRKFFHAMLEAGVYLPPSAFETWFVSYAHEQDHVDFTIDAVSKAVAEL
jgi:glutamate-1-semialdehyde 2,1-aminomutase